MDLRKRLPKAKSAIPVNTLRAWHRVCGCTAQAHMGYMLAIPRGFRRANGPLHMPFFAPTACAGSIPKELRNLGNLENLFLGENQLTGKYRAFPVVSLSEQLPPLRDISLCTAKVKACNTWQFIGLLYVRLTSCACMIIRVPAPV